MSNKIFILLFCSLISAVAAAQADMTTNDAYRDGVSESTYKNALTDNFTEFSPVFNEFLSQAHRLIEAGKFKRARETLTPFIDQFRARLGFSAKSHVNFGLKNFDEKDIATTQKEMVGAFIRELAVSNLSSGIRDKLVAAVNSSLPSRYMESMFIYKRVLLFYLTSVLGEHATYSGGDKQNFARSIFSDFLFLAAPAIRFDTAEPNRYLVLYEFELNVSSAQMVFDLDLLDFVRKYSAYFAFIRTPQVTSSIDSDFKRFKVFQQDLIRRSLSIKTVGKPAPAIGERETGIATEETQADEAAVIVAPNVPASKQSSDYGRPTAVISANAKGALQFDLNSLTEIADSDASIQTMTQDLKIYLTSSTMIWGQSQIQFSSSFTHANSSIKVLVKNFRLGEKFIAAMTELYYAELYNFYLFGKEALIRKNTLDSRNQVYNCLVRMSLAPVTVNCDDLLNQTSMYDENNRKKFSDSYTRLLRLSRLTFEFNTAALEYGPNTQTTCGRIKAVQAEMLNHYKSIGSSYLPSLISIQGPAFKNTSTGQREYLCKGSLNPFLQ